MNVEIEHNGAKCKKFKINGQDFGIGISELRIEIKGGEKPVIMIQGYLDNLNAIIDCCNIYMKEEGKEEYKYLGE